MVSKPFTAEESKAIDDNGSTSITRARLRVLCEDAIAGGKTRCELLQAVAKAGRFEDLKLAVQKWMKSADAKEAAAGRNFYQSLESVNYDVWRFDQTKKLQEDVAASPIRNSNSPFSSPTKSLATPARSSAPTTPAAKLDFSKSATKKTPASTSKQTAGSMGSTLRQVMVKRAGDTPQKIQTSDAEIADMLATMSLNAEALKAVASPPPNGAPSNVSATKKRSVRLAGAVVMQSPAINITDTDAGRVDEGSPIRRTSPRKSAVAAAA